MGREVGVRAERRQPKSLGDLERLVGVDDERVVGPWARQLQSLAAIVTEVAPGALVKDARKIRQRFSDDLLGSVARAGVDDRPGVEQGAHRLEAAPDHMRLILHDHRQAQAGAAIGPAYLLDVGRVASCDRLRVSHRPNSAIERRLTGLGSEPAPRGSISRCGFARPIINAGIEAAVGVDVETIQA